MEIDLIIPDKNKSVLVLFSFVPHLVRGYSWTCIEESLLLVQGDNMGKKGSNLVRPSTKQAPYRLYYLQEQK